MCIHIYVYTYIYVYIYIYIYIYICITNKHTGQPVYVFVCQTPRCYMCICFGLTLNPTPPTPPPIHPLHPTHETYLVLNVATPFFFLF